MISAWTKNITDEDAKARFKREVLRSKTVLIRLGQLLDEMKVDVESTEMNTKIYDIPNWDYRQADTNGFKRALKLVNKIISLDQEE